MGRMNEEIHQYIEKDIDNFFEEQKDFLSPPLHMAVTINDSTIVRTLLDHGADPNIQAESDGMTPLMAAAWNESEELVRLLLTYGADPNKVDKDKWSALFHAAHRGNKKIVKYLLSFGANPRLQDIYRKTPSIKAREAGHINLSVILKQNDERNVIKEAVLYIENGDYESLENWILYGNEINAGDERGNGLLHLAIMAKNVKIAELLLSYGANVNRRNNDGDTALHIASRLSQLELVRLLLQDLKCRPLIKNHKKKFPAEEASDYEVKAEFDLQATSLNRRKEMESSEWHSWIRELYNKVHIKENELLELAMTAGLRNEMDAKKAREVLNRAETSEAIGLAFALHYFRITDFYDVINQYSSDNKNSTDLGRYILACIWFDINKKNISKVFLDHLVEKRFSPACVTLAGIYKLYKINPEEIPKLYSIAAEEGNRKGILELAKCLFYGKGIKKDISRAIHLYYQASQLGVTDMSLGKDIALEITKNKSKGSKNNIPLDIETETFNESKPNHMEAYVIDSSLQIILNKVKDLPTGKGLKIYHIKPVHNELKMYLDENTDSIPYVVKQDIIAIIEILGRKSKNAINRNQLSLLINEIEGTEQGKF